MGRKLSVVVAGAAAALIIVVGLSYYQTSSFAPQNPAQETFRTMQNIYLEPRQTEASNHLIIEGQVVEISIEPHSDEADSPDYELLVTMVDPSGETIINKFIKEPFYAKLRPAHPGWHAIIVTNVGETGIAPGTIIESRPYNEDTDKDAKIAFSCIVTPSMRNEKNTPYPWC
ncbi:MAG TPA: hypothetical protein VF172_11985 [Nitrososphaera sp.]|jgi:hypothetical protein